MNIAIVTGHPAQVHNFKLVKSELEQKGHTVYWLATEKDISKELLVHYGISYLVLERPGKGAFSKLSALWKNDRRALHFFKKNDIDMVISRVSPYVSIASRLRGIPHIGLSDTETSGVYETLFSKLLNAFLSSTSFKRQLRKDQIRFKGNIELFYLHPNRFTPDAEAHKLLGIPKDTPYVVMRFVSWDAYHDKGLSGFSDEHKIEAAEKISEHAKVFISSESPLPEKLEPYRIAIAPEKMHDVLAGATLFFGESATMASESAVLGTPAIYLDKIGRGYTDEEEEFGLVFNFRTEPEDQQAAIGKALELLKNENLPAQMAENHKTFIKDKIDPTAFLVWYIENWPESNAIMRRDSEFQDRFR